MIWALDTDEEVETKDESEDGLPDVEVEQGGEDCTGDNRSAHLQGRNVVLHRCLIFISWVQLTPRTDMPVDVSGGLDESCGMKFEFGI